MENDNTSSTNEMRSLLENISYQISDLNKKISAIEKCLYDNKSCIFVRPVKKELINMDNKMVEEHIVIQKPEIDARLLVFAYHFSSTPDFLSIKINGKNIKYWNGEVWCSDPDELKQILIHNLYLIYSHYNTVDNFPKDNNQFMKNQTHISKIKDEKYSEKIFNHFKQNFNKLL